MLPVCSFNKPLVPHAIPSISLEQLQLELQEQSRQCVDGRRDYGDPYVVQLQQQEAQLLMAQCVADDVPDDASLESIRDIVRQRLRGDICITARSFVFQLLQKEGRCQAVLCLDLVAAPEPHPPDEFQQQEQPPYTLQQENPAHEGKRNTKHLCKMGRTSQQRVQQGDGNDEMVRPEMCYTNNTPCPHIRDENRPGYVIWPKHISTRDYASTSSFQVQQLNMWAV